MRQDDRESGITAFQRKDILVLFLIVTACLAVYIQVCGHGFVHLDDPAYITDNVHVKTGLTPGSVVWAFSSFHASNWHPLTWVSHMLDVSLFGMHPGMHHLVNLLLHIVNSILLFMALRMMTGARWRSAFVAALFALHPLHVESVAWVSERKDVLSALFWLLTMICYARYARRPSARRYLLVAVTFALGLMAKPMLVTLPFVLLLLDFWPLRRVSLFEKTAAAPPAPAKGRDRAEARQKRQGQVPPPSPWRKDLPGLVLEKLPLFALSALSCVLTYLAQNRGGAVSTLQHVSLDLRIGNSLTAYVMYLWKTLWPAGLSHFYPLTGSVSPVLPAASLALLAGVTAMAVITLRKRPYLAFGWLWYLGTLVPVIGIVQVGAQAMADRYTYIPLVGIFIAAAWGAADIVERLNTGNRAFSAVPAVLVLTVLAALAWRQAGYWKDDYTLFSHAIRVDNDNYIAHTNIATFYTEQKRFDEAVHHFEEALRINPADTMIMRNLGLAHRMAGRPEESIRCYSMALKHEPDDITARFALGSLYEELGETDKAIGQFSRIAAIDGRNHRAFYNLGVLRAKKGDMDRAVESFNAALGIDPGNADVHSALGIVLVNLGRTDQAAAHFREALKSDPDNREAAGYLKAATQAGRGGGKGGATARSLSDDPEVLYREAVGLASKGENDRALAVLMKLYNLQPDNPEVPYNIACLQARQGRVDEALAWLNRAIAGGFSDYGLMESDPDLEGIRGSDGYKKIMKKR